MMMKGSLSRAKTADAKDHDSVSTIHAVQPLREGPESDLNVLRRTVQRESCNGCRPSDEGISAELIGMRPAQRASALRGLQQTRGNRYVGRLAVQAKLKIGHPGDKYEQEADRVADRVVKIISSPDQNSVQRQGEENLEEDEELRRKVDVTSVAEGADVGPDLESAIHRARSGGQPLSDSMRRPMERAFGADFGGVRVHTDAQADSFNRSIQARAFTTGQDIFLRKGEYTPSSPSGRELLAHELTHVVQQKGRLRQTSRVDMSRNAPHSVPSATVTMSAIGLRRIFRRPLGSLGRHYENIRVGSRLITHWRTFLQNADDWTKALELNAFMARAVGHTVFAQSDDARERRLQTSIIAGLSEPQPNEQKSLAVALLSTENINLREIGRASPVTGYLLSQFLSRNYRQAIDYITEQAGQPGAYSEWRIVAGRVEEFVGQAGATYVDTLSLSAREEVARFGPGPFTYTVHVPSTLGEIGVSSEEQLTDPRNVLAAQALAGAQAAVASAFISVLADLDNGGTIADRYGREITMHAQVLRGIIQQRRRMEQIQQAVLVSAISVVFAAAGPLTGLIRVGQRTVGQVTHLEMLRAAIMETGKQSAESMAREMSGQSASTLQASFASIFDATLQEQLNTIRSEREQAGQQIPIPIEVIALKNALSTNYFNWMPAGSP